MAIERERRMVSIASVIALLLLFALITLLSIMAYQGETNMSKEPSFTAVHHTEIMAVLVVVAALFGFATAQMFYRELKKKRQDSKNILTVVLLFLSREEREIVNFLVTQQGRSTQAEIARLPHMNNVKAHRSLQKMQEKQLLDVVPHGKVRRVLLKENIYGLLIDEER